MNDNDVSMSDLKFIETILSQLVKRISDAKTPEERASECADFVDSCLAEIGNGNLPIARKVLISGMATLCHNMFTFRDKLNGKIEND